MYLKLFTCHGFSLSDRIMKYKQRSERKRTLFLVENNE